MVELKRLFKDGHGAKLLEHSLRSGKVLETFPENSCASRSWQGHKESIIGLEGSRLIVNVNLDFFIGFFNFSDSGIK